ncbi:MAG: site-specific DNA endonuclease [Microgenomates group bacterium Gr01-1014_16]|nr:MAG: site-specific DNA endonuclease [Microgenomates group bacterium Gr01-1014_16]
MQDNTVGSRSNTNLAYIAGFLDGDGSLMLQLKKRKDGKSKMRFMCTICLYQDSRHEKPLNWMRKVLNIGYVSRRSDGISELRINGYEQVKKILTLLTPFIRFKKIQARAMLSAANLLTKNFRKQLTDSELRKMVEFMITIQNSNYVTKAKRSREELLSVLGLTP